jgi:hypothetical protein
MSSPAKGRTEARADSAVARSAVSIRTCPKTPMKRETKSPLKAQPLRNPGDSVQEQIQEIFYDRLLLAILLALFLAILAVYEWVRYYQNTPPNPVVATAIAAIAVAYAAWVCSRTWPEIKRLRLGRDGERAVGQFLERLREKGYVVFHDVRGNGFNVDHVLIGPAGVLSVETKTFSKPTGSAARVTFDGQEIRIAGIASDRDPVVQAKAQAGWLQEILLESTGRRFSVRPVILFPGWFVEQSEGSTRGIWVLEPKALPAFLDQEPRILEASDVKLASFHLARFIRTIP